MQSGNFGNNSGAKPISGTPAADISWCVTIFLNAAGGVRFCPAAVAGLEDGACPEPLR